MDELTIKIASLSPAKRALLELRLKQSAARAWPEPVIKPRSERGSARASFAQQRLWFLNQLEPGQSSSYNVPRAIRMEGALDTEALRVALAELVRRHEPFRTHFSNVDGELRQIIVEGLTVPLKEIDLTDHPEDEREMQASALAKAEAEQPFDLNTGPVIRTTLLRLNDRNHILLLTTHHIVSDAWSAAILFRELGELYQQFSSGAKASLTPLAIQYADFAEWQRDWLQGEELERQLSYWKQQLAGIGTLALPTDYRRPAVSTYQGAYKSLALRGDLSAALADLSKREGTTLFMTLLAAFQILLSRYTNQEDISVGSPIAGRNRAEIEDLIGFFVNTLTLRTNLSGSPTFRELLQRVKETAVGAYAHQDLPFEKLVEELDPERDPGRNPLFQVMFQYQDAARQLFGTDDLKLSWLETSAHTAKFDLMLAVLAEGESLTCILEYSTDLFRHETIEELLANYVSLLESIVRNPDARIATLPLMPLAKQQQVIAAGLGAQSRFPSERTIHQLFEQQVERQPDAVAIVFGSTLLSFGELNARANKLAHFLRERGVGPEVRVAIRTERSPEMIVGLLGILKAGGAYVPLEPAYPEERTSFILEDSGAGLLLTQARLLESLAPSSVPVVCLDAGWPEISRRSEFNPQNEITANGAAHVIYTSGSTGRPKGVISPHRASVNRFDWMWRVYPFAVGEVCCQKTSLSFVDSIWEIFGPLLQGVPLVVIDDDAVKDPTRFVSALAANKISRLVLVPSLLRVILESDENLAARLAHLRVCVCSGESLPVELATAFRARLPHTRLINLYGASEVAADVTCYEVTEATCLSSVPIGKPIANTQIYILDGQMQPVPFGMVGEIYVGGEGLARGYLNQPALTAERFIGDPINGGNATVFRTGDLGRYLADGNIEYHGRRDHQVKVRGMRIELGEIEVALKHHPAIREAVVVARDDARGDKQLVAYLVAEATVLEELRSLLRRKLPEHMVPAAFVLLESLPLTASGKVNRLALPAPDQNQLAVRARFVAPRTPTEDILATIWAGTLKLDHVGINDDFFALGGHSLLVARIVARVREALRVELPMRALFDAPTVGALAREVENLRQTGTGSKEIPLINVQRGERLPLSFAQERLWFFDQVEPGSPAYNIPRALRLKGLLDRNALQLGLDAIVQRHEVLRTSFLSDKGTPRFSLREAAKIEIQHADLRHLPVKEREDKARSLASTEARRPFDLTSAPLLRASLISLADEDHVLLLTMHHIISDGWSIGILLRELVTLYNAAVAGGEPTLPELTVQYSDFAAWQRESFSAESLSKQLEYWREQLAGAPALINLPSDCPRPPVRSFQGAKHTLKVPREITDQLIALGREGRATLFMTLLTAFQLLLACVTGDEDVVVGSPTSGRNRSETEGLIGYFVNTVVLRAKLFRNPSFSEALQQVRDASLGAFTNQDVPFEKLVEALQPERRLSHNPLFQVWFVLQNAQSEREEFSGLAVSTVDVESTTTRHDLQLTLWECAEGLEGAFTYSTELFEPETIAQMAKQFSVLLATITSQPDVRLSELHATLDDVAREYRAELSARVEESSRQKLKSVKRRAVTGSTPERIAEEALG